MARATWVIIAGAWVMEPTKAHEAMQTIWRMGCALASFWAPLQSSWAKVFFFFNYLPPTIRNSSPLVASSLQRYVCFTSTRSDRGKFHNIDRSFPRRVPHGFTRLEGNIYSFDSSAVIENMLERKRSAKSKKGEKHSKTSYEIDSWSSWHVSSSFIVWQKGRRKTKQNKMLEQLITSIQWRYGEKTISVWWGRGKKGVGIFLNLLFWRSILLTSNIEVWKNISPTFYIFQFWVYN